MPVERCLARKRCHSHGKCRHGPFNLGKSCNRWRSTRWIIGWQVLNQTSTFAGCWRDNTLGIVGCVAADRFNVSRKECCSTIQSQLERTSGAPIDWLLAQQHGASAVCLSNAHMSSVCSVRLWWIFALTTYADNSGLGPSNLHALHIIVRPTMWSFLMVSMSVDNRCPGHNPPFQFL